MQHKSVQFYALECIEAHVIMHITYDSDLGVQVIKSNQFSHKRQNQLNKLIFGWWNSFAKLNQKIQFTAER